MMLQLVELTSMMVMRRSIIRTRGIRIRNGRLLSFIKAEVIDVAAPPDAKETHCRCQTTTTPTPITAAPRETSRSVIFEPAPPIQHHHLPPTPTTMADNKKQTIVHINASITHDSVTARVATAMIDHVTHHYHRHVQNGTSKPQSPEDVLNIEELDVWGDKLPKFDRETMQRVWRARNNSQDEADIAAFRPIQELAQQLLRADFLMITVPVWNFSVPYVVKQYIDCIVQPGLTFKNADASGPSGPYFKGRPLIIISSSGGKAPPPNEDFVVPFLTKIFAMCGFDEPHHVAIEGLANHDKQTCFENAVREANAIADQIVQSHKLRLEANEDDATI